LNLRSDGLTERANRTLLQMLRAVTDDHPQKWPAKLLALLAKYLMSLHSTTAVTPNYAMLRREVLMPCTFIAAPPLDTKPNTEFVTELQQGLRKAHHRVRESLQTSARTEKRHFDRRVRYQQFRVDQLDWLYWPRPLIRSTHRKLVKLWTGPWLILRFDSPPVVHIHHTTSHKKTDGPREPTDALSNCGDLAGVGSVGHRPTARRASKHRHLDELYG